MPTPASCRRTAPTALRALLAACALAALPSLLLAPPAGATLAYVTGGFPAPAGEPPPAPERVWVARDDGSGARELAAGSAPHVSPDGRLVAFDRFAAGRLQLAVVPARGGRVRVLVQRSETLEMAWSPSSRAILAVTGSQLGTKRLVLIDVASGRVVRTLATAPEISGIGFSPRGTRVAFARADHRFRSSDLFAVSTRGGALQRLTRDGRSSDPVWGPRWIAFARSRPAPARNDVPKLDVYLLDPSRLHVLRLTRTRPGFLLAGLSPIAFSGDGLRLLAAFGGQDTLYAEAIGARTGAHRRVGTRAQGLVGWGLSRDGASVLATTGGPDPGDSDVVAIPWRGGPLRVLARHAREPSWNARRGVT